jgi:hypothetical protein
MSTRKRWSPTHGTPVGRLSVVDRAAAVGYALLITLPVLNDARRPLGFLVVLALLAAFGLPIALRRPHPVAALALCLAGLGLSLPLEPQAAPFGLLPMAAVLYVVASACRPRETFAALGVCYAVAGAEGLPRLRRDGGAHDGGAVVFVFLLTAVWVVGYAVGMQRRHTQDLLRDQQDLLRDQARGAEVRAEQARRALTDEGMGAVEVEAGIGDDRPHRPRPETYVVVQGRHRFPESGFAVGEFLVDQAVDEPLLVEGGQAAAGPEKGVVAAGLDESANVGSADLALEDADSAGGPLQVPQKPLMSRQGARARGLDASTRTR